MLVPALSSKCLHTLEPSSPHLLVVLHVLREHVLLQLSEIAAKVLEHMLIIFVFVGTKLARKNDSFSFQIFNKIIQTILPSIVKSINSSNKHSRT